LSVVDSSGWIEFLANDPNASAFEPQIDPPTELVIPTIVLVEVLRWLRAHGRADEAEETLAAMARARVVPLTISIASLAAELGIRHRLPLADSIVYATAQSLGMELWTQDKDFEGLPGVRYLPKSTD
jgi:predicted nucleic acid-binding protein